MIVLSTIFKTNNMENIQTKPSLESIFSGISPTLLVGNKPSLDDIFSGNVSPDSIQQKPTSTPTGPTTAFGTKPEKGFTLGKDIGKAVKPVGDFLSGSTQALGQSAGQVFAAPQAIKQYNETVKSHKETTDNIVTALKNAQALGQDTTKLSEILQSQMERAPKLDDFLGEKASSLINTTQGQATKQIAGEALGTVLEATSGGILEGGAKALAKPVSQSIAKKLGMGAGIGATYGGIAGASQGLQEGDDAGKIVGKTLGGAAAGGALGLAATGALPLARGIKNTVSKLVPSTIKENVSRVLKNTGKTGLSGAGSSKTLDDAVSAFETVHKNANNIIVKDINDVEKVFIPSKATFFELPQALKQTKDAIYKEYSDIAKTAGDAGLVFNKKDFKGLEVFLDKYNSKGYTQQFSNKAQQFKEALARFNKNANPEEIQKLIEIVNVDVNPLSDKAGSQVSNEFSAKLRDVLDSKLEKSGNPLYQETRNKYAQLKSVEKDVIARYKEALRKANANPSVIDGIASLDAIMGVIQSEPTNIIRGGVISLLKKGFTHLRDPEVNMRRVFKLLDKNQLKSSQANLATSIPIATAKSVAKNPIPKVNNSTNKKSNIFSTALENLSDPKKRQSGFVQAFGASKKLELPHKVKYESVGNGAFTTTSEARLTPITEETYSRLGKGYKTKKTTIRTGDYEFLDSNKSTLSNKHIQKIKDYLDSIGVKSVVDGGRLKITKSEIEKITDSLGNVTPGFLFGVGGGSAAGVGGLVAYKNLNKK